MDLTALHISPFPPPVPHGLCGWSHSSQVRHFMFSSSLVNGCPPHSGYSTGAPPGSSSTCPPWCWPRWSCWPPPWRSSRPWSAWAGTPPGLSASPRNTARCCYLLQGICWFLHNTFRTVTGSTLTQLHSMHWLGSQEQRWAWHSQDSSLWMCSILHQRRLRSGYFIR